MPGTIIANQNMTRSAVLLSLGLGLLLAGWSGCTNTSPGAARTEALQNRQDRMNSRANAAAERRQIRSDNMDARTAATFDAM